MQASDTTALGQPQAAWPALVLYARQWLDVDSAEEVVQDAFVRLLSARRRPDNTKAWLFRCVRNAAVDQHRARQRHRKYEVQRRTEPAWFTARLDDLLDAASAESALRQLPDEQREIIVLRLWGGLTLRDAAEATGEAVSTLFSRYRAGLAALRRMLENSRDERTQRPRT